MKKLTVIAMMVGCFCQFAQAQSLEQAVAQTLTTNPKIKEAYSLYLARQYNVDEARGGYFPKLDAIAGVALGGFGQGQEFVNGHGGDSLA